MPMEMEPLLPASEGEAIEKAKRGTSAGAIVGWFSIGLAVAALGVLVGTEIFSRYRFKKRTPYDFYSNAGKQQANEFGVGI